MASAVNLFYLYLLIYLLYNPTLSQDSYGRIIDGILAKPQQYPFVVALRIISKVSRTVRCTGTIITDTWVITGAHCYRHFPDVKDAVTEIFAGTIDFDNKHPPAQLRTSKRHVIHPLDENVEKKRIFYNQDVILIEVDRRFEFGDNVNAINLAGSPFPYRRRVDCLMIGFGWLDPDNAMGNTLLYHAQASVKGSCKQSQYQTGVWTKANLCIRPRSVPCHGDSGGPLVCEGVLVGTYCGFWNHGWSQSPKEPPCNLKSNFFIYTFLGHFEKWIRQTIPDLPKTKRIVGKQTAGRKEMRDATISRGGKSQSCWASIGPVLVIGLVLCGTDTLDKLYG